MSIERDILQDFYGFYKNVDKNYENTPQNKKNFINIKLLKCQNRLYKYLL